MIINPLTKTPEDPRKIACSRCGIMDATVKDRNDCQHCGPTPLCDDCHDQHEPDRNKL